MDLLAPSDLLLEGIVESFSYILSLLKGWIFLNRGEKKPSQSQSQKNKEQQQKKKE